MILVCFGTRPEYIKVKSLIDNLSSVKTCFTGQHVDLIQNINVDYYLSPSITTQNRLNDIVMNIMKDIEIFKDIEYVLVQGDTTSAFAIALSAFHNNKKVIHLEAGLRTHNISDPFPEELNRQLISRIADIHLCPTELNKQNLISEGIPETKLHVVGNTGLDNIDPNNCVYENTILVTLHRRNNLPIMDIWFKQLEILANNHPEIKFILPMHPNPAVQKHKGLLYKVQQIEPLSHTDTIEIIKKCKFIITDSGGIQEESSFLNKKIIICRKDTERPEVLDNHGVLCKTPEELLDIFEMINKDYIVNKPCPFGDGNAHTKIKAILQMYSLQ
jgi:UDP-N-acetylglucosamine 2-epimerase (non-hydrolysing)